MTTLFLRPHPGEPQFFPPGHQLADIANMEQNVFPLDGSSFEAVSVVWGVQGIDRSKADSFDPSDLGAVIWKTEFDLAAPESQQHIYDSFYAISDGQDTKNASLVRKDLVRLNFSLGAHLSLTVLS